MTILTVSAPRSHADDLTVNVDATSIEVTPDKWRSTIQSMGVPLVQDYFKDLNADEQAAEIDAVNASYIKEIEQGIRDNVELCIELYPDDAPALLDDPGYWNTQMEEWATDLMAENSIYEYFTDKVRVRADAKHKASIARVIETNTTTQASLNAQVATRGTEDQNLYARIGTAEREKIVDEVNAELSQRVTAQFKHFEAEREFARLTNEAITPDDDAHSRYDFEPDEWAFDDEFSAKAYAYQSYGYRGVDYNNPYARRMRARDPEKTDFGALRESIVRRALDPLLQRERDAIKREEYEALPKTAVTNAGWTRLYEKFGNGHMRPCTQGMYNGVKLPVDRSNYFSGRWEFDPKHSGNNLYKSFAGNRALTWYYVKAHNAWVDGKDIKWI